MSEQWCHLMVPMIFPEILLLASLVQKIRTMRLRGCVTPGQPLLKLKIFFGVPPSGSWRRCAMAQTEGRRRAQ